MVTTPLYCTDALYTCSYNLYSVDQSQQEPVVSEPWGEVRLVGDPLPERPYKFLRGKPVQVDIRLTLG